MRAAAYYPPGPLRGSGIYDDTWHATAYCDHCHATTKTDVTRYGYTLHYQCPLCGADNDTDLP